MEPNAKAWGYVRERLNGEDWKERIIRVKNDKALADKYCSDWNWDEVIDLFTYKSVKKKKCKITVGDLFFTLLVIHNGWCVQTASVLQNLKQKKTLELRLKTMREITKSATIGMLNNVLIRTKVFTDEEFDLGFELRNKLGD